MRAAGFSSARIRSLYRRKPPKFPICHLDHTRARCVPRFHLVSEWLGINTLGADQERHLSIHSAQNNEPTIYALSTAAGRAAIAVIRISGTACREIYQQLCPSLAFPRPRYAALRKLYRPHLPPSPETLLDSGALILFFPAPRTVTGEDILELHVHGGPAVIRAVLQAIPECLKTSQGSSAPWVHQIRYAEPGEFTRRAFANNRMDLPQIESLGEVLSASTEQQRRLSVRGTTSSLAKRYELWRTLLLQARGELEALIDFSEDQHFDESPAILCASVAKKVRNLLMQIQMHVSNAIRGELLRSGISIALLGAPNAGKSSLLNRIVGREAAIVSQEAGTTRDIVEIGIDMGGWLVKIGDMAGLRRAGVFECNAIGTVEAEGIKRAKQRALESDVVIVVQDATVDIDPEVIQTTLQCLERSIRVVVAINKIDQIAATEDARNEWRLQIQRTLGITADRVAFVCCRTAESPNPIQDNDAEQIQVFLKHLTDTFAEMTTAAVPDSEPDPSICEESLGATERQRVLLTECLYHLENFLLTVSSTPATKADFEVPIEKTLSFDPRVFDNAGDVDVVMAAESLRAAAEALARITGRGDSGDVEEVLGVVFEK